MMSDELKDKLDYEYSKFRLEMLASSKNNIYAHCEEILLKKEIISCLCDQDSTRNLPEDISALEWESNLLEAIYNSVLDLKGVNSKKNMQSLILQAIHQLLRHSCREL